MENLAVNTNFKASHELKQISQHFKKRPKKAANTV